MFVSRFLRAFIGTLVVLSVGLILQGTRIFARVQPVGDNVVIVIDPGHGGDNLGTEAGAVLEKEMTLVTAKAMYETLSKYDNVTVYLTHSGDEKMLIKDRAQFAADVGADFLFSIHYNASENHTLFGSEVWISGKKPFHAYGYQFGYEYLLAMAEKGLFLRGVKTKIEDNGEDYYGILRESAARSIPAVIIEHCHVDEVRDTGFIENNEDLEEFGRIDALAVAKYFGLKSTLLGLDFSESTDNLQPVSPDSLVRLTLRDTTPPEICTIELKDCDYRTGDVKLTVSAADYDSMLIYYDYSMDGGLTWSVLEPWPECNALTGEYRDTFQLELSVPDGVCPCIILRAYNLADLDTSSNVLRFEEPFSYGENDAVESGNDVAQPETTNTSELELPDHSRPSIGTTTFKPSDNVVVQEQKSSKIVSFLVVCLFLVVLMFFIVLVSQIRGQRKRRRRRKK